MQPLMAGAGQSWITGENSPNLGILGRETEGGDSIPGRRQRNYLPVHSPRPTRPPLPLFPSDAAPRPLRLGAFFPPPSPCSRQLAL